MIKKGYVYKLLDSEESNSPETSMFFKPLSGL